jgi:flagellar L-ring protein precursor FlgH
MKTTGHTRMHKDPVYFAAMLAIAAAPALAQLPGLPAAPDSSNVPATQPAQATAPAPTEQTIRPSEKPEHPPIVTPAGAVRGSLFKQGAMTPIEIGADGEQVGGVPVSFTSVTAATPKKYQKNDIVTVIVSVNSSSATSSQANSEKKQDFDTALQQFIQLSTSASGVPTVGVVGQPSKLPEVQFHVDNNRQNQANQQRSDTVTDRFAAIVVDVKPNGTLVLEAIQQVAMDQEVLHYKMSGICRAADITPDNTILSTQLANLNLSKQTTGEVRDGVKRGWFNSIFDKLTPF